MQIQISSCMYRHACTFCAFYRYDSMSIILGSESPRCTHLAVSWCDVIGCDVMSCDRMISQTKKNTEKEHRKNSLLSNNILAIRVCTVLQSLIVSHTTLALAYNGVIATVTYLLLSTITLHVFYWPSDDPLQSTRTALSSANKWAQFWWQRVHDTAPMPVSYFPTTQSSHVLPV